MLWFTVWTLLVVGTLVGVFLLVRAVYRSAKGFLHEMERAAAVTEQLAQRVDELAATVGTSPAPVELVDPAPARDRMVAARQRRAHRDARRAGRYAEAFRRWQAFTR